VGVADEIEEEEEGGVGVWGLHLWVSFEGSISSCVLVRLVCGDW
jgi:hypothetical protein